MAAPCGWWSLCVIIYPIPVYLHLDLFCKLELKELEDWRWTLNWIVCFCEFEKRGLFSVSFFFVKTLKSVLEQTCPSTQVRSPVNWSRSLWMSMFTCKLFTCKVFTCKVFTCNMFTCAQVTRVINAQISSKVINCFCSISEFRFLCLFSFCFRRYRKSGPEVGSVPEVPSWSKFLKNKRKKWIWQMKGLWKGSTIRNLNMKHLWTLVLCLWFHWPEAVKCFTKRGST